MDDDAMEIDSHPQPQTHVHHPPSPSPSQTPEQTLHTLLKTYLTPFITRQITRTLGSEYVPLYGPPPNASPKILFKVLESRWLAVFSDSPLHSSHHLVTRLQEALSCHTPIAKLAAMVEELFLAIGQPTAAAQAAHFRRSGHSAIHLRSSLPATPPPTPRATITSTETANSDVVPDTPMVNDQHKSLVVLDGSNIAWRHGQSKFSLKGLLIARDYYLSRDHPTITFLPETRVTQEHTALHQTSDIVLTPSRDYDDAYIVHYARSHMGVVVSNDEFRDVVYQASADGEHAEKQWRDWLKACRVSFTFHSDTFLPNPAFNWSRAAKVAGELRLRE